MLSVTEFAKIITSIRNTLLPQELEMQMEKEKIMFTNLNESLESIEGFSSNPSFVNLFEKTRTLQIYTYKLTKLLTYYTGLLDATEDVQKREQHKNELNEHLDTLKNEREIELQREQVETDEILARRKEEDDERNERYKLEEDGIMDGIVDELDEKTILELYALYFNDKKQCLKNIIRSYFYFWSPYAQAIIPDYDFLNIHTTSQIVKDAVILAMNPEKQNDFIPQFLKFVESKDDMTIENLLDIATLYVKAPFPLVNCYHEDELNEDTEQKIYNVEHNSVYKCLHSNKKLFKSVIEGKKRGEIKVTFSDSLGDKSEWLHEHIIREYTYFSDETCNEYNILINDISLVQFVIESLYTGSFDRTSLTESQYEELYEIFTRLDMKFPCEVCRLFIHRNDQFLEEEKDEN